MDDWRNEILRAHQGDKEAREQLVLSNLGLIWSVVRRFEGRQTEREDLFQIGVIGLLKAVDHFDLGLGLQFSTYAVPMIAGELKRFLRDDGMIRVSRSLKELGIRIYAARQDLNSMLGREPTLEELSETLGETRELIAAAMEAGAAVESLYRPAGPGQESGSILMDYLAGESESEERLINTLTLKKLMEELPERDRQLICMRFLENRTQMQVAEAFHISQVQVSRLEKKILRSMRSRLLQNS